MVLERRARLKQTIFVVVFAKGCLHGLDTRTCVLGALINAAKLFPQLGRSGHHSPTRAGWRRDEEGIAGTWEGECMRRVSVSSANSLCTTM
jgi:hypothetical protein